MKKKLLKWICVGLIMVAGIYAVNVPKAKADLFGADLPLLGQLLAKAIAQIQELQEIIGASRQTADILEEMNRGVKEVLYLSETAHVPLPPQVYDQIKNIDDAIETARRTYGVISDNAPVAQKNHYRSGVEGLYISEDAFDYSTFLDKTGDKVKAAAVAANQASATKLTAETLGVVLHAISHSNRIQAKTLEILSTDRIENTAKENARYSSYIETHDVLEQDFNSTRTTPLNSFSGSVDAGSQSDESLP